MKQIGHKIRCIPNRWMIHIFLLACNPQFLFAQEDRFDFDKEAEQTAQLIVMLSVEYDEGTPTFGAGIIFNGDKDRMYIATASHVVYRGTSKPKNILVKFKTFPGKEAIAEVLKNEADLDLAVLTVNNLTKQGINGCAFPFDRLPIRAELRRGDEVLPVGNPAGVSWAMPVEADKISQINESQIVFQSTFIRSGHSGGGLLDNNGHLVGMMTADEPPFGRAITMDAILQQVMRWGFSVRLDPTTFPFYRFSSLHNAAMDGNLPEMKKLLALCNNPNQVDNFFVTALHLAAAHGKVEAMSLLLNEGANINAQNVVGDYPLHSAVDNIPSIKLLVKAGAVVNAKNNRGQTILHLAADGEKPEVVKFLIESGADINIQDSEKNTPLHYAIENESGEIVKTLLKANANLQIENGRNQTPLLLAVENDNLSIARLILESGADPNHKNSYKVTPLQMAVSRGSQLEILNALLKAGAKVNDSDEDGNTPLHDAVVKLYEPSKVHEVMAVLLKAGADVNAKNSKGNTPLLRAKKYLTEESQSQDRKDRFIAIERLLRQYGAK
jgi:ankyrin repeat protein